MSNFWIQTRSGKRFDLLDPKPAMVKLTDIAHALANINRFTGHAGVYSVAQHSVLVSKMVPKEMAKAGLLHDAAEAYISDISRPLKMAMRSLTTRKGCNECGGEHGIVNPYDVIEERVAACISEAFGLPWPLPPKIKEVDMRMVLTEKEILGNSPQSWELDFHPYPMLIVPQSAKEAEESFLVRWGEVK